MIVIASEYLNYSILQRNKTFTVKPEGIDWTVLSFSVFLNELPSNFQIKNYLETKEKYDLLTIEDVADEDVYFIVHIDKQINISTKFSLKYLTKHFTPIFTLDYRSCDNRGRVYASKKVTKLVKYSFQLTANKETTRTFTKNHSFLFFLLEDFSKPFIYFVKQYHTVIAKIETNAFIFDFFMEFLYIEKSVSITTL